MAAQEGSQVSENLALLAYTLLSVQRRPWPKKTFDKSNEHPSLVGSVLLVLGMTLKPSVPDSLAFSVFSRILVMRVSTCSMYDQPHARTARESLPGVYLSSQILKCRLAESLGLLWSPVPSLVSELSASQL